MIVNKLKTIFPFLIFIFCLNFSNILFKDAFGGMHFNHYTQILNHMMLSYKIWIGVFFYGIGTIFWIITLKKYDLGFVYPFVSINYPIIQFGGWFFFDEVIGIRRVIGVSFIVAGLIIMYMEKNRT